MKGGKNSLHYIISQIWNPSFLRQIQLKNTLQSSVLVKIFNQRVSNFFEQSVLADFSFENNGTHWTHANSNTEYTNMGE